jgi:hypothetical protein
MSYVPGSMNNPMFMAVGDHADDGPNAATVTVRLSPVLAAYLAAMAQDNDRSLSDEIRAALKVHRDLHRISLLADSEMQAHRKVESEGVHGVTGASAMKWSQALREDVSREWAASFPAAYRVFSKRFPSFLWDSSGGSS